MYFLVVTYTEEKVPPPGGVLVISQYQSVRIGPEPEEMNPTSLPDLFKQPRTFRNSQELEQLRFQLFEKLLSSFLMKTQVSRHEELSPGRF